MKMEEDVPPPVASENASTPGSVPQVDFNSTTSSLFSILANLCTNQAQQQQNQLDPVYEQQSSGPRDQEAHISRNRQMNPNSDPSDNNGSCPPPINSSLISLLNNSGDLASSQSVLNSLRTVKASLSNQRRKSQTLPLNAFIENIAARTGSNIGPSGIAEAKKIIEKFTTSLLCSSQTIADHYVAPFSGEPLQQKPEISPSDVALAYKMMHKSHGQP